MGEGEIALARFNGGGGALLRYAGRPLVETDKARRRGGFERDNTEQARNEFEVTAMLRLPLAVRAEIEQHGRDAYPQECCGFLIGEPGRPRAAKRALRLVNQSGARARHRFEIDPLDWLRVERGLSGGEQVIGVYHSHPDRPSRPSELDREGALPHMSYVIVAVGSGVVESLQSFELQPETWVFDEETVEAL